MITSSNLDAIKVGSRVVYASAAGDPTPSVLDSDLVIDGPGDNTAFRPSLPRVIAAIDHAWTNGLILPWPGSRRREEIG